jgi:flagellar motor switch protein FliN/FliY
MSQTADASEDELNRAILELRGVLGDDKPKPVGAAAGPGAATASEVVASSASIIMNIPVEVQVVLGSTEMPVSELLALQKGSTVALDRKVGEPVDVVVNGRRIASGEITVLENDPTRFGIRLTRVVNGNGAA